MSVGKDTYPCGCKNTNSCRINSQSCKQRGDGYPRLQNGRNNNSSVENNKNPCKPSHKRKVRVYQQGAAYFITTVTANRIPYFSLPSAKKRFLVDLAVALIIKEAECYGFALLPDHIHLIIQVKGDITVSDFMHSFKRNISRNINKIDIPQRFMWQPSFREHILRNEQDIQNHFSYIFNNPKNHQTSGLAKCYPKGLIRRYFCKDAQNGENRYSRLRETLMAGNTTDKEIDHLVYELYNLTYS